MRRKNKNMINHLKVTIPISNLNLNSNTNNINNTSSIKETLNKEIGKELGESRRNSSTRINKAIFMRRDSSTL